MTRTLLIALLALVAIPAHAQTWNPGDPTHPVGGRSQSQTFVAPEGMEYLESVSFWLEPANDLPTFVRVHMLGFPKTGGLVGSVIAPLTGEGPSLFTIALGYSGRYGLPVTPGEMYTVSFVTYWWALNEVPRLPGVMLADDDDHIPGGHAYVSGTWTDLGERIEGRDLAVELKYMATPEPVSMTLLGTGLAGVAVARRRKREQRGE